ncbi:MAG TPA: hypothetical protein VLV18_00820, partial [Terriglobales bacterium]|nr:hypothetical protein [Terriglobales bacterium]
LKLTHERYGRIPKSYIETLQDRAISPMLQRKMYTASKCSHIIRINTSHSPFLSQPTQLAKILTNLPT